MDKQEATLEKIRIWQEQIDLVTNQFLESFQDLTNEDLSWHETSDSWSIAQNIDHLITINRSYYPIFGALRKETFRPPFAARFRFLANLFGNMLLKSVQPTTKKKTRTFPRWQPQESPATESIFADFAAHQDELKQQIQSCQRPLQEGKIIHSPVNKNIVYALETAFDILVTHEKRHLEQARKVLEALRT